MTTFPAPTGDPIATYPPCPFQVGDTVRHRGGDEVVARSVKRFFSGSGWFINSTWLHNDDPTSVYRLTLVKPKPPAWLAAAAWPTLSPR